jgi:hypothetical protein
MSMSNIKVLNQEITLYPVNEDDYISLTDIARYKDSKRTYYPKLAEKSEYN